MIQNPAREREELFKIKQERERRDSKSSKRERGGIQNPAREREEVFKIQQERDWKNDDGGKRRDEEEEEEEEWAEFGAT